MTKLIRKNTFVVAPKNFATDTIEIVNLKKFILRSIINVKNY